MSCKASCATMAVNYKLLWSWLWAGIVGPDQFISIMAESSKGRCCWVPRHTISDDGYGEITGRNEVK